MNIVDSCGWLEYIADGPNAAFFGPALTDLPRLVVPVITIYEVYTRILVQRGQVFADRTVAAMGRGRVVDLDAPGMRLAAVASLRYKLVMADAIIWQTAQVHGALLLTQDVDLKDVPGVQYRVKG
jgi:predicted nucleic acid-binding protein